MLQRSLRTLVVALLIAAAGAARAQAASIVATPNTVTFGATVTLTGDVLVNGKPGCEVPATVTLISGAFPGDDFGPGQGAVNLPVDTTGHFSGSAVVKPSAGPATYEISARCGGGNLGVIAHVTVTELPRTGGSIGPLSDSQAIALGVCLILAGVTAISFARRKSPNF